MVRRSIWPLDLIKRIGQRDGDDAAGPFSMFAPDSNQSALDGLDSYVGHKAYAEQLRASLPAEEQPPLAPPIVARVQSADGFKLKEPTLCDTSLPGNAIIESLAACDVEVRLNHESILVLAGTVPEAQEDVAAARRPTAH